MRHRAKVQTILGVVIASSLTTSLAGNTSTCLLGRRRKSARRTKGAEVVVELLKKKKKKKVYRYLQHKEMEEAPSSTAPASHGFANHPKMTGDYSAASGP